MAGCALYMRRLCPHKAMVAIPINITHQHQMQPSSTFAALFSPPLLHGRMSSSHPEKKRYIAGVDQTDRVDPWLLADKDSRFAEFNGVQIHFKLSEPSESDASANDSEEHKKLGISANRLPAILLHGFGASLFSWERVLKPLASVIGSKTLAFDRPAFGLTSRPQRRGLFLALFTWVNANASPDLNPFSLGFSAAATLSFIDFLPADKAVLIGHSAGCIVALQAYLDAPERVAGLILLAPAIAAPILLQELQAAAALPDPATEPSSQQTGSHTGKQQRLLLQSVLSKLRFALYWALCQVVNLLQMVKTAIQAVLVILVPAKIAASTKAVFHAGYEKLLIAAFHSALAIWVIRIIMDKLGTRAVRRAWYDSTKANEYVINGYTKPLRSKDWEQALLEFLLALLISPSVGMQQQAPLTKRLKEVTCPVLVITGDTDQLVPAWNAKRLVNALPQAKLSLIKECGHLPHEETPDEFLALVKDFFSQIVSADAKTEMSFAPT
ncbi:unnamed protein product [Sphagnum jensenii]|uniref:AB hydrolase-1 domain-containing protein n=1 Tax=Sphagnum jensenii TaxID=128206 RepID=A0ABP1BHT7_9BRYO